MKPTPFYVDFNSRESSHENKQTVLIHSSYSYAIEKNLQHGSRVVLYEEGLRCEGILRRGSFFDGWVADIVPGTFNDISTDEFERLKAETKRAGLWEFG